LATAAQFQKYQSYLDVGTADGATLDPPAAQQPPEGGWYAMPAIFTGVRPASPIAQEEIFGPVLAVLTVSGYDEAVEVVNGTSFGLSAGVVTDDLRTAIRFSRDVEAGVVKVNQPTSGLAMNAPFGGFRLSSTQTYKEQGGPQMLHFYTREKTVYFTP
jgi:aldehyde dehydrogenase (NAD+)